MDINLTGTSWQAVSNLVDDTTYFMQAKVETDKGTELRPVTFTQAASEPASTAGGITGKNIKFKKKENNTVYIKGTGLNLSVHIEEV